MTMSTFIRRLSAGVLFAAVSAATLVAQSTQAFVRDPKIPIDAEYTAKIKEYTTQPFFTSPLVDYLPASKTVPTPKAVLGDVAGAPGKLPYAALQQGIFAHPTLAEAFNNLFDRLK